jgi:hypothetical protein
MAKKEKVSFEIPTIKMAEGKKPKTGKPDRPVIESPVTDDDGNVVDKAIEISQNIESMTTQLEGLESLIKDAARTEKDDQFKADNFVKTVDVQGTSHKIQIQFRDAYSKMDVSMKDPLKKIFTDKYAIMFDEIHVETLRQEKVEELKGILGARFTDFFNVEESIKPSKEFQYNYFALRKSLKADQTATVQKILESCQSNAAVKYPK